MAKKVEKIVRLQIPVRKIASAPLVNPVLGQAGINIMGPTRKLNIRMTDQVGLIIPVVTSVYEDRLSTFITKAPPVTVLLRKVVKTEKGSGELDKTRVVIVSSDQVEEIAKLKMANLNTADVEAAMRMVVGTIRSMSIIVE